MENVYSIGKDVYLFPEKKVGRIEGDTYHSRRSMAKGHFFRLLKGWALSTSLLQFLGNNGVNRIILEVRCKTGKYNAHASLDMFRIKGKEINYGEKQILLPEVYWSVQHPVQENLFNEEVKNESRKTA